MEYLDQVFDSSGILQQFYWDPSSSSLVVVDGRTGVTLGSQVYPSREGAVAAIQANYAQAQANAPDTRSTLTKAKDWLEEKKEKHEAKKLSELGLKVREARAQEALDTI